MLENAPVDCVSVDVMESRTPRFVAQLKVTLTKRRYKFDTMFKYQHLDLTCAHLHQSNDGESVAEATKAFEACARNQNTCVKHYHADNGKFADNSFIAHL